MPAPAFTPCSRITRIISHNTAFSHAHCHQSCKSNIFFCFCFWDSVACFLLCIFRKTKYVWIIRDLFLYYSRTRAILIMYSKNLTWSLLTSPRWYFTCSNWILLLSILCHYIPKQNTPFKLKVLVPGGKIVLSVDKYIKCIYPDLITVFHYQWFLIREGFQRILVHYKPMCFETYFCLNPLNAEGILIYMMYCAFKSILR